jgi:tetratricopeptide (TPR) repeat protein
VTALERLGMLYMNQKEFAGAQATFAAQLKAAEELYGPQSPAISEPLELLGNNALFQRDFVSAQNFFSRELEVNEKTFGETSAGVANSLRMMARFHYFQQDYEKAEPFLLRAVKIDESLYGYDGDGALINLSYLCGIYDRWGQPGKSEPCDRHLLAVLEKQHGANSPVLASTLTSEAQALRSLGRAEEAAKVEERLKSIQALASAPN